MLITYYTYASVKEAQKQHQTIPHITPIINKTPMYTPYWNI